MKRYLIMALSLLLALCFYLLGFQFQAMLAVGVGMFFEVLFWITLINRRGSPRER